MDKIRKKYELHLEKKRKEAEEAAQTEAAAEAETALPHADPIEPPESTISIHPTSKNAGDDGEEDSDSTVSNETHIQSLGVSQLQPGVYQPRRKMDERALTELSQSIKQDGVIQPILVRPLSEPGRFEIVAGERRWRASKVAGLETIPAIIRSLSDAETMRMALIENIQRADLNAIEEATAIDRLMVEFKVTQKDAAALIGKSVAHVSRMLTLMSFTSAATKEKIAAGEVQYRSSEVEDEIRAAKENHKGKKSKPSIRLQKVRIPQDLLIRVTELMAKNHQIWFEATEETTVEEMVEVLEQAIVNGS